MRICKSTGLPLKVPGLNRHLVVIVLMVDSSKPYPNPLTILQLATVPSLRTKIETRLTEEERLAFYEHLAHNLTIAARDVWSSDDLPADKAEQLKWLNEIQHRVTAKISVLHTRHHEWTEKDSWRVIEDYISNDMRNESRVLSAVESALETAKKLDPLSSKNRQNPPTKSA